MQQGDIVRVISEAINTIIVVAAPLLVVAMVVGVIVSIFQATTQINEQTLSFVPKIIAIFVALLIFGGWMLTNLTEFTARVFDYAATALK